MQSVLCFDFHFQQNVEKEAAFRKAEEWRESFRRRGYSYVLGKHAKQIFGKSWDFVPRRGGVWPNPNFYKALFLWHIWPFYAENFRVILD